MRPSTAPAGTTTWGWTFDEATIKGYARRRPPDLAPQPHDVVEGART
jgi:hypothetical protein